MQGIPLGARTERVASALGILCNSPEISHQFVLQSSLAFIRAPRTSGGQPHLLSFSEPLQVEAVLEDFSYLSLGAESSRQMSINSICALLKGIRFLPGREAIDPNATMYIPALAINSHVQTAA
jgi:hypothetical protein